MKRIFVLAFATVLLSGSAMAQEKKDSSSRWAYDGKHHHKAKGDKKQKVAKLAKDLNLTDAQKQQLKSINEEYKGKDKSLRDEKKAKAQAVLTSEQKAKLEQMKTDRKNKMKAAHEKKAAEMKKDLNLSDAQGQQIKSLNEDFKKQADAIRNNSTLTQDQKKEQLKALGEQRKAKMNSILTPEQQQKLEAKKQTAKGKRKGK